MYVPVRLCQTERHTDSTGKDRASYRNFAGAVMGRRTDRQGKVRSRKKGGRIGGKVPSRNYPASCDDPLPRDISMVKRVVG